jgi:hypothetical protein
MISLPIPKTVFSLSIHLLLQTTDESHLPLQTLIQTDEFCLHLQTTDKSHLLLQTTDKSCLLLQMLMQMIEPCLYLQ